MSAELLGPQLGQTHIHRDADHPRAELAPPVEAVDAANDLDERVLRQIRCHFAISHHAEADAKESVLVLANKGRPRRRIAGANASNQRQITRVGVIKRLGCGCMGRRIRQGGEVIRAGTGLQPIKVAGSP